MGSVLQGGAPVSRLTIILREIISKAAPDSPAGVRLQSGLCVGVRVLRDGRRQMSLTRTATQKPAMKEAEVCRDHAGWVLAGIEASTTRSGLPCLLVTEAGA